MKIFLAVADSGSLSGAAVRLGINHSTVFRRLQTLEEELKGRLFERIHSGYELTPLGEELLKIATGIEEGFNDLDRHIVGKDVQPRGLVKITTPNDLAYYYLPRYLHEFNQQYPDIQTEILVSNTELNMNNRQADIAVRATPAPPEHLVGRQVNEIPWSVCSSEALNKRFGIIKTEKAFSGLPWISGAGSLRNLPVYQWMEKHLANNIVHRCDDLVAMSKLAETGCAFAILPNNQFHSLGNTRLIKGLRFQHSPPSKLWLLTHPELRKTERIRLVMQHLANKFSEELF